MNKYLLILEVLLLVIILVVGINLLTDWILSKTDVTVQGLHITNVTEDEALFIAYEREPEGDWIMVNVRDMTYRRALDVCAHEVGHEIFAEECEDNITRCMEVADGRSV